MLELALKWFALREILLDELAEDSANQLALVGNPVPGLSNHDAITICIKHGLSLREDRPGTQDEIMEELIRTHVRQPRLLRAWGRQGRG